MKWKYVAHRLALQKISTWRTHSKAMHCCSKMLFQFSFSLPQTHSTCFCPANQLLLSIVANDKFSLLLTTSYFKVILFVIVISHGAYCDHHYTIIWLYFSSGVHFIISECLLFNPPSAQRNIIANKCKIYIKGQCKTAANIWSMYNLM